MDTNTETKQNIFSFSKRSELRAILSGTAFFVHDEDEEIIFKAKKKKKESCLNRDEFKEEDVEYISDFPVASLTF